MLEFTAAILVAACGAPGAPEVQATQDVHLTRALRGWANRDAATPGMRYRFRRTDWSWGFKSIETRTGEVAFRRPDLLLVDMQDARGERETLFFTGQSAGRYDWTKRSGEVRLVPDNFAAWSETLDLGCLSSALTLLRFERWVLTGPPAHEAEQWLTLRWLNEDKDWIYIGFRPRTSADKSALVDGRFVIARNDGFWVRQIWIKCANGDETIWDIEKPDGAPRPPVSFASLKDRLPPEWREVTVPEATNKPKPRK